MPGSTPFLNSSTATNSLMGAGTSLKTEAFQSGLGMPGQLMEQLGSRDTASVDGGENRSFKDLMAKETHNQGDSPSRKAQQKRDSESEKHTESRDSVSADKKDKASETDNSTASPVKKEKPAADSQAKGSESNSNAPSQENTSADGEGVSPSEYTEAGAEGVPSEVEGVSEDVSDETLLGGMLVGEAETTEGVAEELLTAGEAIGIAEGLAGTEESLQDGQILPLAAGVISSVAGDSANSDEVTLLGDDLLIPQDGEALPSVDGMDALSASQFISSTAVSGVTAGAQNTGLNPINASASVTLAGEEGVKTASLLTGQASSGGTGGNAGGFNSGAESGQRQQPFLNMTAAVNNSVSATVTTDADAAVEAATTKVNRAQSAVATVSALSEQMGNARQLQRPAVTSAVMIPVTNRQWPEGVAEKVAWLSSQNIQSAEIKLDPPELGALSVRIQLNQDQTTVNFTAQHGVVREALEQTAVRLREMLSEQGLELVGMDVSSESHQQNEGTSDGEGDPNLASADGMEEEEAEVIAETAITHNGLVDHFV